MKVVFLLASCWLLAFKTYSQKGDSLRIITYNIHHAGPPAKPGTIDIDVFIALFKKYPADVIALQEVDVNTKRSGNINEAKAIGDALGMHSFFAKAIDYDGGQYGVALLSRFPLKDTQVIYLSMDTIKKGEQRVLATARLTLPSGRSLVIGCTHLDHQKDPKSRKLQLEDITAFTKTKSIPFVVAGDLNAEPTSDEMRLFDETFQRTCDVCPPTYPANQPAKTIDYIGYKKMKGIKVMSHQVLPEPLASDHLPLRAVIKFQ
jgi:endonuclease/exonuclease/phosphatase family metal-dependent hydrolase